MTTKPCKICKRNVTPKQSPGISCSSCLKYHHFNCLSIQDKPNQIQLDSIQNNSSFGWLCKECKIKRRSIILNPSKTTKIGKSAKTIASTKPVLVSVPEFDLIAEFKSLRTIVQSLESRIKSLETENFQLKNTVSHVERNSNELEIQQTIDIVEIQGLSLEECSSVNHNNIVEQIGSAIGEEINTSDIISCSISTKLRENQPSTILHVKFVCTEKKKAFIVAGKRFTRPRMRCSSVQLN